MLKFCDFCNKEYNFEKHQQWSNHRTNCKFNPNCQRKNKRISESLTKPRFIYKIKCKKCGTIYELKLTEKRYLIGNYRKHCSRHCSNSRVCDDNKKNSISIGIRTSDKILKKKKPILKKTCLQCDEPFTTTNPQTRFCTRTCGSRYRFNINNPRRNHQVEQSRLGGINSSKNRVLRSKNEIYFYDLCKEKFKNVKHNENIFNGWDADIIIEDIKCAVLWNGKWHYEKITKSHSLEQVQNRDKIKIDEIKKAGYVPYIVRDMGSQDEKFVENEFRIFYGGVEELVPHLSHKQE